MRKALVVRNIVMSLAAVKVRPVIRLLAMSKETLPLTSVRQRIKQQPSTTTSMVAELMAL